MKRAIRAAWQTGRDLDFLNAKEGTVQPPTWETEKLIAPAETAQFGKYLELSIDPKGANR